MEFRRVLFRSPRSLSVPIARQAAPRITAKKNNSTRPTQHRSVGQSTPSKGPTLRLLLGSVIWSNDVVWVTFVACFRTLRDVSVGTSVVLGKSVSVSVDLGGRGII